MVRPDGPCPARVMLVGEAPGEREVLEGRPFVGQSGMELDRMLGEAGLSRSDAFVTNVVRVRPPRNDITEFIPDKKSAITHNHVLVRDRMCLPIVAEGFALLQDEVLRCRPNVIITLGNVAMWALTGKWGVKNYRGSLLETDSGIRVVPSYHPAAILRQWELRALAVQDLRRAAREAGGNGVKCPDYQFLIRPQFTQAITKLTSYLSLLDLGPLRLSVDIETNYGHITCIGFADSKLSAICIPFIESQRGGAHYWPEWDEAQIIHLIYRILTHPNCRVIWQNGLYDAQYIFRAWHFIPRHHFDTMIGHHSCFSTMPKSLDLLSSMYCEYHVYWKGVARGLNSDKGVKKDD